VTAIADAIEDLRRAVSQDASGDPSQVDDVVDKAVFENAEVVRRPADHAIDFVSVAPTEPTTVEDLEAVLGPARPLPRNPSGGLRNVIFEKTVPGEGESGATVLAQVEEDGRVRRLIVRSDAF
jgi:hypothetical protein